MTPWVILKTATPSAYGGGGRLLGFIETSVPRRIAAPNQSKKVVETMGIEPTTS